MTLIIMTLSLLIPSQLGRKNSGTDLGTGYGGTVCGFHTLPKTWHHSSSSIISASQGTPLRRVVVYAGVKMRSYHDPIYTLRISFMKL